MAAYSPTPWNVATSPRGRLCIVSPDAWICGELSNGNGESPGEGQANADFIVQACNAHDELVAAADDALNALIGCCIPAGGCDDRKAILDAQMRLRTALRLAGYSTPELPASSVGGRT